MTAAAPPPDTSAAASIEADPVYPGAPGAPGAPGGRTGPETMAPASVAPASDISASDTSASDLAEDPASETVAELVAAMTAPRPTDWRVGVWRSFLRAHTTVLHELEHELAACGMPLGWYDVLLQLAEAPGRRLRMAELASAVLLSRSGLTRVVDRLQTEGLVRREPSRDDARGTYTVLTDDGLDRLRAAAPVHLDGIGRHWLAHFDDAELRHLGELMNRVAPPSDSMP